MLFKSVLLALLVPVHGAVHEALSGPPFGWTLSSQTVSLQANITLQAVLQYANLDKLEPLLESLSTPGSPQYGDYIDLEEQNRLFAPSVDVQNKVTSWLNSNGITEISCDGTLITFTTTVCTASTLLNTTFAYYTDGRTTQLRTLEYSIPDDLTSNVDFITPTTIFGDRKGQIVAPQPAVARGRLGKRQTVDPSCLQYVVYEGQNYSAFSPECYKQSFNIGDYQVDISAGSTVAFTSFVNMSARYSDLALFEQAFAIPHQNFTKIIIANGATHNLNKQEGTDEISVQNSGEANVDLQAIVGLAGGLPITEYITGGLAKDAEFVPDLRSPNQTDAQNEPWLEYYRYMLSQKNVDLPYVISSSYSDRENTVSEKYARRVCNMIGMLGLRGRTVLNCSGNSGPGYVCRANTGAKEPQFTAQFPASCPYITAVGGTQFINPPHALNQSSGGFSLYFSTPFYQKSAVSTYLSEHISPDTKDYYSSNGYVNFSGRGFPDLAANADNPRIVEYLNGTAVPDGGTSISTPAVAAVIALLNDVRLRAGKPVLGFINPLLYGLNGAGLADVTEGGALGCNETDINIRNAVESSASGKH